MADSHAALIAELAAERQRSARLREALSTIQAEASPETDEEPEARLERVWSLCGAALAGAGEATEPPPSLARLRTALRQIEERATKTIEGGLGYYQSTYDIRSEPAPICGSRHGNLICGKTKGHSWFCGGEGIGWGEKGPEGGPDV